MTALVACSAIRERNCCRGHIRWADITPPEWLEADTAALAQLASTGSATAWEKELIAKDGRRVPILAGAVMLEGSEGIAIAIDLTERKAR